MILSKLPHNTEDLKHLKKPRYLIHATETKGVRRGETMKISRLRHQPDSYSPFCLLVLRPTLRIQTQGRSAEKRETQSLYRQGCGGGRQETTAGSCIAHLWEGTAVGGGKKEGSP